MTNNAERAYGRSSYVQLRRKLASRKQLLPASFPFPFFLLENSTIWWDGYFFLEKWTRNCCEDNDKVDLGSSCIGRSNMIWEAALLFFSECFFFLEHWRSWLYYEGKESKFLKIDIVAKCQFFRLPAERERNYYRTKNSGWNKHRL